MFCFLLCTEQVKALRELPPAATAAMTALLNKSGSSSATKVAASVLAGNLKDGAEINNLVWMEQQVRSYFYCFNCLLAQHPAEAAT